MIMQAPFAVIFGAAHLHESLLPREWIGCAIILLSGFDFSVLL
jgi:drug/metabolite transporter (DMT)-like permease